MSELMTGVIKESEMLCGSITEAIIIIGGGDKMDMEIIEGIRLSENIDVEIKHGKGTEIIFMQLRDNVGNQYYPNKLYASDENTVVASVGENLINMQLLIIYKTE